MSFLVAIPILSFGVLLYLTAFIHASRGSTPYKGALVFFCSTGLGLMTLEMAMLLPGAAAYHLWMARVAALFWMFLGFGLLNSVYRLLGRPNDVAYYVLLFASGGAALAHLAGDFTIYGIQQTPLGPVDMRHIGTFSVACLPTIVGSAWALVSVGMALWRAESAGVRRVYRILLVSGILSLVMIALFTVVLPNHFGMPHMTKYGTSMFVWFMVMVLVGLREESLLNVNVDAVADEVFEDMHDAVVLVGEAGIVRRMNLAARRLFNLSGVYAGMKMTDILPAGPGGRMTVDFGGGARNLFVSQYSRQKSDVAVGRTIVVRDDTDIQEARTILRNSRDELEKVVASRTLRLRQAQRLEALATISGGIAQEFNSLLSETVGHATAALERLGVSNPVRDDIEEVLNATRRARQIVKQMLSFTESGAREYRVVDVGKLVRDTLKIVQVSVPNAVQVQFACASAQTRVKADPTRIHQAVLNLVTNALHAMGEAGGTLFVGVHPLTVKSEQVVFTGTVAPGAYASITVKDTGSGISPQNMARIFEPFFTTKKQGEGTGIGLATVLRVIEEHGGQIDMETREGEGTRFTLYLPTGEVS